MIASIVFIVLFAAAVLLFTKNVRKVSRYIKLGKDLDRNDQKPLRWKTMARVALGQSKMTVRPIAGILHIIVYLGFILINIEVIEIIVDGIFGTHRFLSFFGGFYDFMIWVI